MCTVIDLCSTITRIQLLKYVCLFCNCYVVDGGWSSWTPGPCSKTCGIGTVRFTRTCTNPKPFCGGLLCIGNSIRKEPCEEISSGKIYGTAHFKLYTRVQVHACACMFNACKS